MPKDDHDSIPKLLQLYNWLLSGRRVGPRETATELRMSRRTVQRYLKKLQDAGVALETEDLPDRTREYFLSRPSPGLVSRLPVEQIVGLNVALGWLQQFEGNVIFKSLDGLRQQVAARLVGHSVKRKGNKRRVAQKFVVLPSVPTRSTVRSAVFRDVVAALQQERKLRFFYEDPACRKSVLVVQPLTLVFNQGKFSLVALVDPPRPGSRPRTFSLSSMTRTSRLTERFDYPRDWDPRA